MELYVNLNTQINVEVCRCCCYVKQILLSCMHTCLGSTFVASFDTKPRVLKTIDRRHLVESAFVKLREREGQRVDSGSLLSIIDCRLSIIDIDFPEALH